MATIDLTEFQKRAMQAGISKEQVDSYISNNFLGGKTAEQHLDDVYTHILSSVGVEKNEKTAAYVEGFLTSAIEAGAPFGEAVEVAKQAMQNSLGNQKQASTQMVAYYDGFTGLAKEAGYSPEQVTMLLKFANEQAAVDPAMVQQLEQLLAAEGQGQPQAPAAPGIPAPDGGAEALKAQLVQAILANGQSQPQAAPQAPMFNQPPQ